jgi:hypothetical protein
MLLLLCLLLLLSGCTPARRPLPQIDESPGRVTMRNASVISDPAILLQIYSPVLKHLASVPPVAGRSLALVTTSSNASCHPHCADSTLVVRDQPRQVGRALQQRRLISGLADSAFRSSPQRIGIGLGVPFRLHEAFEISPARDIEWVGAPSQAPRDASIAVDVHLDMDTALVGGRESPDLRVYRYFLVSIPGGYAAVARILNGQT